MGHTRYYVNDKRVRSVTTMINDHLGWNKQALIGWTRKQCLDGADSSKVLREAGKIGTLAHKMIECNITNTAFKDLSKYTPQEIYHAKKALYGFVNWKQDKRVISEHFKETEIKMVSKKYKFGGTCDGIVLINDTLHLVDFKTSSGVYNEYIIQLAAYRQMWKEHVREMFKNHHNKKGLIDLYQIRKGLILHLDKETGEYTEHIVHLKNLDWGWKVFKLILKMEELKNDKAIYR